jgi:hypothetical protein
LRRHLEHRGGTAAADYAKRAHASYLPQWATLPVEEDEVEGESHAEGVDAAAAGDQQARAGPLAAQKRQSEQPRIRAKRHRDLAAKHHGSRKVTEPAGLHIAAMQRR